MATTIGRVEFIVGLDGNQLPAQARRLANQMEQAGKKAGDGFSDGFDSSFDRKLSQIGDRMARQLSSRGALAGRTFAQDFESTLQTRFRKMQGNLADILSDQDTFTEFARGFDTVGEAVDAATADLERLRGETVQYTDEQGRLRERLVLTSKQFRDYEVQIRRLGGVADEQIGKERALARATEDFEASWARLSRTIGDGDAFRQMSEQVGGTDVAFRRLSHEIEGAALALGKGRAETEDFIDRLSRTREGVDNAAIRLRELENESSRLDRAFTKLGHSLQAPWRNLDNDVRLVLGLIIGAADQIATLGSAAGAGLLAIGGAAATAVAGVGGLATVLTVLSNDIEDLPPELRDAARELDRFKTTFTDLGEVITKGAVAGGLAGAFDQMSDSVQALNPEFTRLGISVGHIIDDFALATAEGTDGFEQIRVAVRNASDNFHDLADGAGTFTLAILRGVNRANPLVQDLLGYFETLADRLDSFTRSSAFDDWMRNADSVFTHLAPLLDASGRALNDLVTPESVAMTTALLDDLTGFIPVLGDILGVVGSANPLGLIAQALNEAGQAVTPLLPALDDLAEALGGLVADALPAAAYLFTVLATAITPVIQDAADFIDALPPEAIQAIVAGLGGVATAFALLKGQQAISGALAAIEGFSAAAGTATTAAGKLGNSLKANLGKAGLIGVAAAGAFVLVDAVKAVSREILDLDDKTRNFVANGENLTEIFKQLNTDAQGNFLAGSIDNLGLALERLDEVGTGVPGIFSNIGLAFSEGGSEALALSGTLKELDAPLTQLANTSVADASKQFSTWAEQLGATDDQVLAMINQMPEFKQVLEDAAAANGQLATDQDLVNLALGRQTSGMVAADQATRDNTAALAEMEGKSVSAGDAIDGLSDKIRNFGSATLTTREAERQFQQAIDDVSASVETNGTSLDINTQQGRDNQKALDDLAESALDFSAATYDQTGSQEQATAALQSGRDALILQLQQFGFTQEAAEAYADELGLIPGNIDTIINLDTAGATSKMDSFIRTYQGKTINVIVRADGSFNLGGGRGTPNAMATGGTVYGPTHALIGEAGPEAVVPLNRPLSQVDPSVRALSAMAQGIPALASGGIAGARTTTVGPGAIVVNEAGDARRTANEVLQRLAENVVG